MIRCPLPQTPSPASHSSREKCYLCVRYEVLPMSRAAHWAAGKLGCIPAKIARNRRNSSIPSLKPDRRKCPAERHRQVMERLSLEGHAQSSFHYSIRRTQCDQQPMIRRKQLDFVSTRSDTKVFASQSAGDVRLRPPQDSDF